MNGEWLGQALLRAASFLAPGHQRAEWLQEWQSELWYIPPRGATFFCLGAFQDALWVRRNNLHPLKPSRRHLESPASCLAFLAILAAVSVLIAACLQGSPKVGTTDWCLRARDLAVGCMMMLFYTFLLLPITGLVMGGATSDDCLPPWPSRLRMGLFLAAKIALLQPVMLCGLLLLGLAGPLLQLAAPLAILTFRWLILDQRDRCPVCLRSLTRPVCIGTPSRSFLDWYGTELMCPRGHGLLQVPEISTSYSGARRWLRLDGSWSGLFPRAAGIRQ
jgi:hypothetical protein